MNQKNFSQNSNLKKGILKLNEWCKYNQLYINWEKTKIMYITNKRIEKVNFFLFNDKKIEIVEKFKILRVTKNLILVHLLVNSV